MNKHVFLHVGSPKTATSLVQQHFANSNVLADRGIAYPDAGRKPGGVAHHQIAHAVMEGEIGHALQQLDQATAGDCDVLLSSEAFTNCIATPPRFPVFLELLAWLGTRSENIRAIIFLREASSFFESMFLHTIKATGLKVSFDEYIKSRKRWYEFLFRNLEAIARYSPGVMLDAYAFQPRSYPGDWNRALGFDLGIDISRSVNRRLSLKSQSILKEYDHFREVMAVPVDRYQAIKAFSSCSSPFEDDIYEFSLYRPGMAERVRQDVLSLARRYGRDEYLDAFEPVSLAASPTFATVDYSMLTLRDLTVARDYLQAVR